MTKYVFCFTLHFSSPININLVRLVKVLSNLHRKLRGYQKLTFTKKSFVTILQVLIISITQKILLYKQIIASVTIFISKKHFAYQRNIFFCCDLRTQMWTVLATFSGQSQSTNK